MFNWLKRLVGSATSRDLQELDENENSLYVELDKIHIALVNLKVRVKGIGSKDTREECLDIINNVI